MAFKLPKHLQSYCEPECPNRSPTCHNEETCDRWRAYQEKLRAQKASYKYDPTHAYCKVKSQRIHRMNEKNKRD